MALRLALAAIIAGALPSISLAKERVPLNQIPPVVLKVIEERFNQPEWLSAERETKGGSIKFDVRIRSDGKKFEIEVTSEGQVTEVRLIGN